MKKLAVYILVLIFVLIIVGCKQDASGEEIQVGREVDFDGVIQIKLTNGHNGYSTTIADETDMANIISFVGDTVGKPMGSGNEYYEGSYSVTFYYEDGEEFHLIYGDDAAFYMGNGDDGYPIRYRLTNMSITDNVIPFFSQYDNSGMVWNETD